MTASSSTATHAAPSTINTGITAIRSIGGAEILSTGGAAAGDTARHGRRRGGEVADQHSGGHQLPPPFTPVTGSVNPIEFIVVLTVGLITSSTGFG